MALKGTIRDFGVADIFQLIGQQVKTGILVLNNDVDEVRVYFREGSVIKAENVTRPEEMLFGNLMVRADALSPEQLDRALQTQQRTLKRLGTVLVELGFTDAGVIREFATLQTTETIYKLFEWQDGTYEFEPTTVDDSPEGVAPIRAENIVMNGVRMMDEWPTIREQIPSYSWVAVRLKRILPAGSGTSDIDFSSFGPEAADPELGPNERTVFGLSTGRVTIQEVIDQSRLGEFEACRALSTLVAQGYVKLVQPRALSADLSPTPLTPAQRVVRGLGILARIAVTAMLVLVLAGLGLQVTRGGAPEILQPRVRENHWAKTQLTLLRRNLEVYRLSYGAYPEELEALTESGLVEERDLSFPFEQTYFYRSHDGGYTLLPPAQ